MRQLHRTDLSAFDRLGDVRVDVLKLRLAEIDIDTAQNINAGRNRLPVEGHIVGDVEVQVLVQCLDRELRTADRIGLVNLIVIAVRETQIRIAEHTRNADFAVLAVNAHHHDNVRIVAASHRGVTRVDTEGRNVPVALHLCDVIRREHRVLDVLYLKHRPLYFGVLLQEIGVGKNGCQYQNFQHRHNDEAPPFDCLCTHRLFLRNCRDCFLSASASLRLLHLVFHKISCVNKRFC